MWTKNQIINPNWFIPKFFHCDLWSKQQEIARSVWENKITAVRSCHASGKSFVAGRIGLHYLQVNPNSKVITTAPSLTQVKDILWREIASAWHEVGKEDDRFKFAGDLMTTKIDISPDWFARGLATRKEGEGVEVAQRMLGFHSKTGKILIIVDEGAGIKEPIWNAIDTLLTSADARLLALGNPYKLTGGFADLFRDKAVNKIHISGFDTPNVKAGKVIYKGLMSPEYPKEMAEKWGEDSNYYLIKVLGEFPRSEKDSLIPITDVLQAMERRLEAPDPAKVPIRMGVDVARKGDDMTAMVLRQGKKVIGKRVFSKQSTMTTVGKVLRAIDDYGVRPEYIYIDIIGLGAGVYDRLREKGLRVAGIKVSRKAQEDNKFYNLRAEAYWKVREWIKDADLPDDDDFIQLSHLKYDTKSTREGQIIIESKAKMKKRGLRSPDVADALMLTFARTGSSSIKGLYKERDLRDDLPDGGFFAGVLDEKF